MSTHIYHWRKFIPAWKGRPCRVLARGNLSSIMIEFTDNGEKAITHRYAVRKVKP